jgi:membrane protein YdbS with pleckstrin-like domain
MSYPRRLIQPGETVVLDLKPHWWFFARQIGAGLVLFVLLLILFVTLDDGGVRTVSTWAWGLVALAWAVWLAKAYLDWQFTYFVVTDKRVVYRTGVLAKHGVEIPLARINNINFHQGIVDRLVGAGSLEIESAGTDGESRFSHVRHPDGVQQEIYRVMEDHERTRAGWGRDAPPPAPAAPSPPDIPEQLRRLAELRDSGVISAAEFEAKKAQLLERM